MTLILAIETTDVFGSVALLDDFSVLADATLPNTGKSAQTLPPTIQSILQKHDIKPKDIEAVAVVQGPGSFTGLRVGVATAKLFAFATGAKLFGIDTIQVIAEKFNLNKINQSRWCKPPDEARAKYLSIGIDAQRGEIVRRIFAKDNLKGNNRFVPVTESILIPAEKWWDDAASYAKIHDDKNLIFSGSALDKWNDSAPNNVCIAPMEYWHPRAVEAGQIAVRKILEQVPPDSPASLLPIYARKSAAEERLMSTNH